MPSSAGWYPNPWPGAPRRLTARRPRRVTCVVASGPWPAPCESTRVRTSGLSPARDVRALRRTRLCAETGFHRASGRRGAAGIVPAVGASRRFLTRLILITAGAAAWRVYYIVGPVLSRIPRLGLDDEFFYSAQARLVADAKGFLNPFGYFAPVGSPAHRVFPTAVHPPLYTVYLAIPAKLGLSTPAEQRVFTALLGVATVFLIGILARRLAGDRVGLIAALLAAISPALWSNDSVLGLESLYGLLVVLLLITVFSFWRSPTVGRAALLALWLGLATLTRSEGIILFAFIALPAIVLVRGVTRGQRWKLLGVMAAVGLVVVGPWVVRNLTTFERPTLLGTG